MNYMGCRPNVRYSHYGKSFELKNIAKDLPKWKNVIVHHRDFDFVLN